MKRPRFYFLEASKVGTYHITLIDGYLAALAASSIVTSYDFLFCAHESLWRNLSTAVRAKIAHRAIPVVNQDRHHVVRKSLLEFWVVLRHILRLRRGDVLFISCLIPSALLLVELANRLLRKRNIFVVIHGEIEAPYNGERQSWRKIGYWAERWIAARRKDSLISVVVIDDFIKTNLLARFPGTFKEDAVFVVHHPVSAITVPRPHDGAPTACFIGYRSAAKGFDEFRRLASAHPAVRFIAIGGGKVEDVSTGRIQPLGSGNAFHQAVAGSAVALFPYLSAYDCSLSAAVLDALSCGVHIAATPRACFESLAAAFGPDAVSICRDRAEFDALLSDPQRVAALRQGQQGRLCNLEQSKYGLQQVKNDFELLCGGRAGNASD